MPRGKRNTPFQPGHGLLYGLRPVARDPETNVVTSVACRFCEKFGREEKVGAKRRATQHIKYFRQPFRTENYHQHHVGQHRVRWTEYKLLSAERKVSYLATNSPSQDPYAPLDSVIAHPPTSATPPNAASASLSTPHPAHASPESTPTAVATAAAAVTSAAAAVIAPSPQPLSHAPSRPADPLPIKFLVRRAIVDGIIADILLDPNAELTKERAIAEFTSSYHSAADYLVSIKNTRLFDITTHLIRLGATPSLTTTLIAQIAKIPAPTNGTTAQQLDECSEAKVAAYVRCVIAHNLQALSDLLRSTWAFSLSLQQSFYLNTPYVDISVRIFVANDIQTLHLISFPAPHRVNQDAIFKSLSCVLDILCSNWRDKLLCLTTDGSDLTHVAIQAIFHRIRPDTSTTIIRTWSAAHQLDLIIRSVYRAALNDSFCDTLSKLMSYLQSQDALLTELNTSCPKLSPSSWLSIGKSLRWVKTHRIRILRHIDEKEPGLGPPTSWWVLAMALHEFTLAVSKTYNRITGFTAFIAQQTVYLLELEQSLYRMSGCKGPITDDERNQFNEWDVITDNKYFVQKSIIRNFLSGLGSFVHISMSELPPTSLSEVVDTVGTIFLSTIVGLSNLIPNREEYPAGSSGLPPVTPQELVRQTRATFNGAVRNQAHRLSTTFKPSEVEQIEEEFGEFLEGYHREETLKEALQKAEQYKEFLGAWGVLRARFQKLFQYCGGLATAYPDAVSSPPHFSIQPPVDEAFQISGLSDFSLEGSLHCYHFQRLHHLWEEERS